MPRRVPGRMVVGSRVDAIVAEVNRRWLEKGLEAAMAVGEYLLETLFEGSVAVYQRQSREHPVLAAVLRSKALRLSAAQVRSSLALMEQLEVLPRLGRQLPLSHHKLLFRVLDRRQKQALAQQAVTERLTSRQLGEVVRATVGTAHRGRPAKKPLAAFTTQLGKLVHSVEVGPHELAGYGPTALEQVRRDIRLAIRRLERLEQAVEDAIVGHEIRPGGGSSDR